MKPSDLTEDQASDDLVWVWNTLETAWVRMSKFYAFSLFKTWPSRYTEWRHLNLIPLPEIDNAEVLAPTDTGTTESTKS